MELDLSQFWSMFLAAVATFYPQDLDPGNLPQSEVRDSYDFIIVGGGTAGCVLANRLTENPEWSVLLIEAGGAENAVSDTPLLNTWNFHSDRDWNYTTVPQSKACLSLNGSCVYPRGHVLGGGSAINGMMYVRGNKADYDGWVKLGCIGWSYEDVLPYFIKSENCTEPSLSNSSLHGKDGYLNVQYPRYVTKMREEYVKAGEEFGWTKTDYNVDQQGNIIGYAQFNMDGPSRESSSKAFLLSIRERQNLNIIQRAIVSKILLKKSKALGVEYYRDGKMQTIYAKKEVIISAGSIDTPKLLMLSGIGTKKELEKHGIDVIADLPVGIGLQDHPLVPMTFKINHRYTIRSDDWRTEESINLYAKERKGPLTSAGGEATAFFNPVNSSDLPNFQIIWDSFLNDLDIVQHENLINILGAVVHPQSRGSVKLKSRDFRDPPLIDPNYYGNDFDFLTMKKGLQRLFDFMKTPTMAKYSPEVYFLNHENCKDKKVPTELIDCMILQYTQTIYHPVATARMGHPRDKKAVVSPNLMVLGFENLRVIDASIMPVVPRANTNAATYMIAEKGADIVKAAHCGEHTRS